MIAQVYDFMGLIFLYPLQSLGVFLCTSFLVRLILYVFVDLPPKTPFWFQVIKSAWVWSLCIGASLLILDQTIFRSDPTENPLAHIQDKNILLPCSEFVILRKIEEGVFAVPLIAQQELRTCLNLRQGEMLIGKPLAKNLVESSKTESLASWLTEVISSIDFKKGEKDTFPSPFLKKKSS